MGQVVVGVLYGCAAPARVELYSDDSETEGLLPDWQQHQSQYKGIDPISVSYESGYRMIGCWVRIASDGGSAPNLLYDAIRISELRSGQDYLNARDNWRKFAAWAKKRNVVFPRAELWIAPTEVG